MTTAALDGSAPRSRVGRWIAGVLAIVFGVATLVEGGRMVFGGSAARAEAGNIVTFVLLFNFGAAFAYVLAGVATLRRCRRAIWVARALAASTLLVFAAFGIYVLLGGAYELRTLLAMILRSGFWIAQALVLPRLLAGGRHG